MATDYILHANFTAALSGLPHAGSPPLALVFTKLQHALIRPVMITDDAIEAQMKIVVNAIAKLKYATDLDLGHGVDPDIISEFDLQPAETSTKDVVDDATDALGQAFSDAYDLLSPPAKTGPADYVRQQTVQRTNHANRMAGLVWSDVIKKNCEERKPVLTHDI